MFFGLRFVILHFDPKWNLIHLRSFYDALAGGDVTKMESIFDTSLHSTDCTLLQQLVSLGKDYIAYIYCELFSNNSDICIYLYIALLYFICSKLVPFTLVAIKNHLPDSCTKRSKY